MTTIDKAREVASKNREFAAEIGYMQGNGPEVRLHLCAMADTIDTLLAELATLLANAQTDEMLISAANESAARAIAELDALKAQQPVAGLLPEYKKASWGAPDALDIRGGWKLLFLAAGAQPTVTCQIYGHVVGACAECNTQEEAPVQAQERNPLTDAAIWQIAAEHFNDDVDYVMVIEFARAIEAKIKEQP